MVYRHSTGAWRMALTTGPVLCSDADNNGEPRPRVSKPVTPLRLVPFPQFSDVQQDNTSPCPCRLTPPVGIWANIPRGAYLSTGSHNSCRTPHLEDRRSKN